MFTELLFGINFFTLTYRSAILDPQKEEKKNKSDLEHNVYSLSKHTGHKHVNTKHSMTELQHLKLLPFRPYFAKLSACV